MKYLNRAITAVVLLVLFVSLLCPAVLAAGAVDLDAQCSVTIDYTYEDTPIAGTQFKLYRVANLNAKLELTPAGEFKDMVVDFNDLTGAALQLTAQVANQKIPADQTVTTNEDGKATVGDLFPGAYLLIGQPTTIGDRTRYVDPQVIILPQKLEEGGDWSYDLILRPKSTDVPVEVKPIDVSVVKVWKDKKYANQRPASITVRLLRNGQTVSTVVLSAENNWKHTWTGLLPNAKWTVEEDVPKNYVVDVEEKDNVFTLTNYRKDIDQTGHVWWPVVLVLCVGLALIVVGVVIRRSGRREA